MQSTFFKTVEEETPSDYIFECWCKLASYASVANLDECLNFFSLHLLGKWSKLA